MHAIAAHQTHWFAQRVGRVAARRTIECESRQRSPLRRLHQRGIRDERRVVAVVIDHDVHDGASDAISNGACDDKLFGDACVPDSRLMTSHDQRQIGGKIERAPCLCAP